MNTTEHQSSRPTGAWAVAFAAMVGMTMSGNPIGFATNGIFLRPITAELGWTRTDFFAAASIATLISAVFVPFVGRIADTLGVRRVLLAGVILYAVSVAMLSMLSGSLAQYAALTIFSGCMAMVQGPLLYSKAVSQAVDRRRGLALAIAMSGSAVGTAFVPHVATWLIGDYGWRTAKIGLGVMVFLVAFPAVWFFIRPPQAPPRAKGEAPPAEVPGMTMPEIRRTRTFWLLVVVFLGSGLGIHGAMGHLGALVGDRGLDMRWAATALTALALGQLTARFGAGLLLDRFKTPQVGQLWFVCAFFGLLVLIYAKTPIGIIAGAALVGAGLGAELELLAYYVGRFFGLRAFGQAYGLLFASFMLGVAGGPLLAAKLFDWRGDYGVAFAVGMGMIVIANLALALVGRYSFVPGEKA